MTGPLAEYYLWVTQPGRGQCGRADAHSRGAGAAAVRTAQLHCRAGGVGRGTTQTSPSGQLGGTMARVPARGLADVVAASTALSDIDGQAGRLSYRGYDINDLAGVASFEEIAFLLQRGAPPAAAAIARFGAELAAG